LDLLTLIILLLRNTNLMLHIISFGYRLSINTFSGNRTSFLVL
jgi:hypothetical protein